MDTGLALDITSSRFSERVIRPQLEQGLGLLQNLCGHASTCAALLAHVSTLHGLLVSREGSGAREGRARRRERRGGRPFLNNPTLVHEGDAVGDPRGKADKGGKQGKDRQDSKANAKDKKYRAVSGKNSSKDSKQGKVSTRKQAPTKPVAKKTGRR